MPRFSFILTSIAWAALAGTSLAQDVTGQVKHVDAEKGTITLLEGPAKALVENTYNLIRPDVPVQLAPGKLGKVSDLREGAKVAVELLGADVTAIRVLPVTVVASFSRRDEKAKVVAIRLAGSLTETVFFCDASVPLLIQNKSVPWSELKPGQKIQLTFLGEKTKVAQAKAGPEVETAKETKVVLTRQSGVLLDHDPARLKASVLFLGASLVEKREFQVAADAQVKLFHAKRVLRNMSFGDLAPLVKIHYFADLDTRTIVAIDAEMPVMKRRLVALDVEKGKITFEDGKKLRTLDLAAKVEVFRNATPVALDQVQTGFMTYLGLSLERTRVEAIFLIK